MVKFLTKQEKKAFIKSVAIALPNHVMLCLDSRIMLMKLIIMVSQFWWSGESGDNRKCMHRKS